MLEVGVDDRPQLRGSPLGSGEATEGELGVQGEPQDTAESLRPSHLEARLDASEVVVAVCREDRLKVATHLAP